MSRGFELIAGTCLAVLTTLFFVIVLVLLGIIPLAVNAS